MANILVHKIGSGKPADGKLQAGEFGVDVSAKILWVGTGSGEATELSGGDINWNQIIEVPGAIDIIINPNNPDYIDISDLEDKVDGNTTAITDILAELIRLEAKIDANAVNIATNAADILTNAGKISANASLLSSHDAQITANTNQISINTGNISTNTGEIADIWAALKDGLTGLTMGGEYNAANNQVENPSTAGLAAGLTDGGALPSTESTKGLYVIVTTEGVLNGTGIPAPFSERQDGKMAYSGDWLVSDGIHGWVLLEFHTEATLWGMIGGDITQQTDLQSQFATKVGVDDTIGGGNYNG